MKMKNSNKYLIKWSKRFRVGRGIQVQIICVKLEKKCVRIIVIINCVNIYLIYLNTVIIKEVLITRLNEIFIKINTSFEICTNIINIIDISY